MNQCAKTTFPIRILLSLAFVELEVVEQELLKEFDDISFTDILFCQKKDMIIIGNSQILIGISFRKMVGFTDPFCLQIQLNTHILIKKMV